MYSATHISDKIAPQELDHFLSRGWYRMVHTVFAANILRRDEQWVNAIWLRHPLRNWKPGSTFQKLAKRNRHFRIEFGPLQFTDAHEVLYQSYRSYKFDDPAAAFRQSLLGPAQENPFDSWMVNCYDGDRLVAAGVFDRGEVSAAGIVSFYDPAYVKWSLGKYLIYQKLLFCQQQGLEYFYPGYLLTGVPDFDYKLGIGGAATEFYQLRTGDWLPWSSFSKDEWHLELMVSRLEVIQQGLLAQGREARLVYYENFDVAFYSPYAGQFWDCPVYLNLGPPEGQESDLIIRYDIRSGQHQFYLTEPTTEEEYVERDGKRYCLTLKWFERVN